MKRIFVLLFAMLLIVPSCMEAQDKMIQKAVKSKVKEYEKAGWKIYGTSLPMNVALTKHYEKILGEEGAFEVSGSASNFKSKNVGKQMAINSACQTYAQSAGSHVKGRVVSDMNGDGVEAGEEFENFYAAYERLVEKEIKGEMKESYTIIKESKNGPSEMLVFYVINEEAASRARIRALENAAKESEVAQKHAQKVSDFIREGFSVE